MRVQFWGQFSAALLAIGSLAAQDAGELFRKLDANKDGYVAPDEVQDAQKALFERLLRSADKNNDGKLSQDEFQSGLQPVEGPRPALGGAGAFPGRAGGQRPGAPANADARPDARGAEEMFAQADANKDGKVSKDEVPADRRERFSQMVERLNPGGDSLSKEQFVRGMMFMGQAGGAPPPGRPNNPANMLDKDQLEALFDRTDSNSDLKLTKDEIPEERQGMRAMLERAGGESIGKEQFVRGMMAMGQAVGQPPRPEGAPPRRPDGPPGGPPGGGLFGALDADRNGEISSTELIGAGAALLKLDRNGDGKLTPEEVFGPGGPGGGPPGRPSFARPGNTPPGTPPAARPEEGRPGQRGLGGLNPEEFRQRLKEADANNDGKLSKDEAPALLKERFDRVDGNSDGFVDQEEVRRMLERMRDAGGKAPGKRPDANQPRRPDAGGDK